MSSYFDEMGKRIYRAEREHSLMASKLLNEVKQRVGEYLGWIERNALKAERERVADLRGKYQEIINDNIPRVPSVTLERLHSFSHEIGRATICLHGGGVALDNPYFPGHYGVD